MRRGRVRSPSWSVLQTKFNIGMISIVIAEDENITRYGIKLILESASDFKLLGEAEDGQKAVTLVRELQPDILLLDLKLPKLMGFDVARQVKQFVPRTRILVLSSHDTDIYVKEAMQSGADGYVLKGSLPEVLFKALREVSEGRKFLCPPLSKQPIGGKSGNANTLDLFDALTSRERLVLQLAAEGLSSAEIGSKLHISPRTVETHRANLMRKLELHSQTELVLFAIRRGIVST